MKRKTPLVVAIALMAIVGAALPSLAEDTDPAAAGRNALLAKLLDQARDGKPALAEVRLEVAGPGAAGSRMLVLFGDGVGIWNGAKQFKVSSADVRTYLKWIDKAGFCAWPEKAARIGKEKEREVDVDALQADRSISLTIGRVSKTVTHVRKTPEAAPFNDLVARLLDACEKPGASGLGADSLADGLAKVRDGVLAPQALRITLNTPQQAASDPEGWLLRVWGLNVEAERNTKAAGYGDRRDLKLSQQEFRDLVTMVIAADPTALPGNIVAPGYTDLRVAVLDRTRAIQARAFAGAAPAATAEAGKTLAKLRDGLHQIYLKPAGARKPPGAE